MYIKIAAAAVASVVSDSVWPRRRKPTRLPRPWDSPGKNTGVGCHCLLQCVKVKSLQSCPTLKDPMDCSLPGSSIHGIFQARVLEQGAISSSRGSSRPRNRTQVSHIIGRHTLYPLSHQGSHLMMLWCKAVANKTCYTENLNTAIFLGGHSLPETGHPALCLCLIVQTS